MFSSDRCTDIVTLDIIDRLFIIVDVSRDFCQI
jgi:hypothetical protein